MTFTSAALAQGPAHRGIWLEVPEANIQAAAEENGTLILPKEGVQFVRLHITSKPGQVSYASISLKVNTEVANVVATERATDEGISCDIDLQRNPTVALHPGPNSLEIAYKDRWNQTHYASFLLNIPEERQAAKLKFQPPVVAGGKKFAVVIGISRYKSVGSGLVNLRYAGSDAAAFRDFLISPKGGFQSANIEFLQDEDATLANIREALSKTIHRAGPNDTLLIYIDSHGATDPGSALDRRGNNFVLAYDSDPASIPETAMPISELETLLVNDLRERRVILFVDTNHANGIGGKALNLINDYWAKLGNYSGLAVLTANDKGQASREGDEWGGGHGIFTHYLLKGLGGDADQDGDGTVTVAELFSYVRKKVNLDTGYAQDPLVAPNTLIPSLAAGLKKVAAAADESSTIGPLSLTGVMANHATGARFPVHGK